MRVLFLMFILMFSCSLYTEELKENEIDFGNLRVNVYCDFANNVPINIRIFDIGVMHAKTVFFKNNNYSTDFNVNYGSCDIMVEIDVNQNGIIDNGDYTSNQVIDVTRDTIIIFNKWQAVK